MTVPASPEVICAKPPKKIEKVGSWQFRNAMPGDCRGINIFNLLTIDMDFELVGELRDPLDYDALRAVALIEERRYNRQTGL